MSRAVLSLLLFALLAAQSADALAADRYALLVGVKQYKKTELTNLRFSEADVTELAEVLKASGYAAKDVVLMSQARGVEDIRFLPTAANVRTELALILKRAEAGDSVLIAFAGHGVQFKGEPGAFFCPMDAELGKRETLLPLAEIYAQLEKCPAAAKFLLVDACRNEIETELRRAAGGVELEPVGKPQSVPLPKGLAAFFSCDTGQFAYEHPALKHGVFFHFVLEGLRGGADLDGDRGVDIDEINTYVRKRVKDYVADELSQFQSPRMLKNVDGTPVLLRIERPIGPPPLAIAPFDAATAKKHQADWASYLKVQPVTNSPSTNMKLVLIPPGEFLMGSPAGEENRDEDETQHRVRITKPYYLGQTEVTIGQFRAFVTAENFKTKAELDGEGGFGYDAATDKFEGYKSKYTWQSTGYTMTDDHPVVNISWNDAQAYCAWLTRKEGKTYRLPTEAEWEYACRAGTTTTYQHGNDPEGLALVGNIPDGTGKAKFSVWATITARDGYVFSAPVAQFQANGFGLYDMLGNVWEQCSDWYGAKYYEALAGLTTDDPPGDESEQQLRILRGGSWSGNFRNARSANRFKTTPNGRYYLNGFRVARTP